MKRKIRLCVLLVSFALASVAFAAPVIQEAPNTASVAEKAAVQPVASAIIQAMAIQQNVVKPAGRSTYGLSQCRPTFTAKDYAGLDRIRPLLQPPI